MAGRQAPLPGRSGGRCQCRRERARGRRCGRLRRPQPAQASNPHRLASVKGALGKKTSVTSPRQEGGL